MNKKPLVSIIVTTRNNQETLEACLLSIQKQTYPYIEVVVVDRDSTDNTKKIAQRYTEHIYNKGPERCAQRNFGASRSQGTYLAIIDSDMELSPNVIESCVALTQTSPETEGIVIPEESFGLGFWAQCKRLERSFYHGIEWIEAARFFKRDAYLAVGGYNETLVSGEDWELSQRVGARYPLGRISSIIRHNEGKLKLFTTLRKKVYYSGQFNCYLMTSQQDVPSATHGNNPYGIVLRRFKLYLSHPIKLFRRPHLGIGMLFMKVCEFGFGALGLWSNKRQRAGEVTT